jgi:hypothetical protein
MKEAIQRGSSSAGGSPQRSIQGSSYMASPMCLKQQYGDSSMPSPWMATKGNTLFCLVTRNIEARKPMGQGHTVSFPFSSQDV